TQQKDIEEQKGLVKGRVIMTVVFTRCTTKNELQQILDLQKMNLGANVKLEEKEQEGFVTVSHSLELLSEMNAVFPPIVAKDGNRVVGYALCMHPSFKDDIEILKPMFLEISAIVPHIDSYMIMGQICIAREYRKQGIFRKLYEHMGHAVLPEFKGIITEVDAANQRSLQAHYAMGFTELKTYVSGGQEWKLIVLK
ncbi:MAG TPA: GNAT family N-acetyltransferase, partial [Arenibacter sp.]|nr:GNAT family N-acetyltransferase [Arenibacter sp.]